MAHQIYGRHFGRTRNQRRALFRNLVGELVAHGRIKTTLAKAKAIKPLIDKLVTKAKRNSLAAQRDILATLSKESALELITTVAPRFANRTSGFSRIIRLGQRSGDDAEIVFLEWSQQATAIVPARPKADSKPLPSQKEGKIEAAKKTRSKKRIVKKAIKTKKEK